MRRLAIMTSIIGAAAFAALLVWGLTFGSVQAQTPTPTVEASPTATVEASPTATVEASPTATPEYCGPVFPTTFTGTVTVNGQPAVDGTTITAIDSENVSRGSATTANGSYTMDVPETMPIVEPCFPGGTISFTCDGVTAAETGQATGGLKTVNLTCGVPEVSPTPTPTPTQPPPVSPTVETPTPTPTVPSPGLGGASSSGGSMWWPLALAAAALTSVVGLFTARWARR